MSKKKAKKTRRVFDADLLMSLLKKNPGGFSTAQILQALETSGTKIPGARRADRSWSVIKALRSRPDEIRETKLGAKDLKRPRSAWALR